MQIHNDGETMPTQRYITCLSKKWIPSFLVIERLVSNSYKNHLNPLGAACKTVLNSDKPVCKFLEVCCQWIRELCLFLSNLRSGVSKVDTKVGEITFHRLGAILKEFNQETMYKTLQLIGLGTLIIEIWNGTGTPNIGRMIVSWRLSKTNSSKILDFKTRSSNDKNAKM